MNKLKEKLSSYHGIKVVAGFGPRYLHSVGQLQKGGPKDVWSIFFYDENLSNIDIQRNMRDCEQIIKEMRECVTENKGTYNCKEKVEMFEKNCKETKNAQ